MLDDLAVRFLGAGWGLSGSFSRPLETFEVGAGEPDRLDALLEWLGAVSEQGDPNLVAVGFITYEAGVAIEGSGGLAKPTSPMPLALFGLFDIRGGAALPGSRLAAAEGMEPGGPGGDDSLDLERGSWTRAVAAIRAGIGRGDVYQANLTRRICRYLSVSPVSLAASLYADNPVPYAVAFEWGGLAVVSNSPELFLDADLRERWVESSPIKGTVRRGDSPEEDARALASLVRSEKDRAENVMIVDLVRNDLGRVSVPGGVSVPRLAVVKTLTHLHHLESTVRGVLDPAARLPDLLRATLPAGSITGAPKRAALRFIHALEPVARGPYTGAAGFVRGDGRVVLNVAIRTAVVAGGRVEYHAGGGITWDSDPAAEWEETETKSLEFFRALEALSPGR